MPLVEFKRGCGAVVGEGMVPRLFDERIRGHIIARVVHAPEKFPMVVSHRFAVDHFHGSSGAQGVVGHEILSMHPVGLQHQKTQAVGQGGLELKLQREVPLERLFCPKIDLVEILFAGRWRIQSGFDQNSFGGDAWSLRVSLHVKLVERTGCVERLVHTGSPGIVRFPLKGARFGPGEGAEEFPLNLVVHRSALPGIKTGHSLAVGTCVVKRQLAKSECGLSDVK